MIVAIADTHAIIWYLAADRRLSKTAQLFIETTIQQDNEIGISSITLVEMVYLVEKGRITIQHLNQILVELKRPGKSFIDIPVDAEIALTLSTIQPGQIPDMPDRIIAATALKLNVPLISRDAKIQLSNIKTIW
jgi:PIN domain nuclease of toxin-antitoxin system